MDRRTSLQTLGAALAATVVPASRAADGNATSTTGGSMELGAFSVSLTVKDIEASRLFYEQLGFKPFMGSAKQNWMILRNGPHVIGLFHGMFDRNIMTFNPGWNSDAQKLPSFTDVRDLQRTLKRGGVPFVTEADEKTTGPASFMIKDPDGNAILVDQHV